MSEKREVSKYAARWYDGKAHVWMRAEVLATSEQEAIATVASADGTKVDDEQVRIGTLPTGSRGEGPSNNVLIESDETEALGALPSILSVRAD